MHCYRFATNLLVDAGEKLNDPEARTWLEADGRGGQVAKMRKTVLALDQMTHHTDPRNVNAFQAQIIQHL